MGNTPLGKFPELRVINVNPVGGQYVPVNIIRGLEHETVVDGRRCELYIRGHTFVGINDGVHFYAAFLPARPGMAINSFEKEVGKQCYRGVIDDLQAAKSGGDLPFSAVRGKCALVPGIQLAVYALKHLPGPARVGIGQSATPQRHSYAQMADLRASGSIKPVISRKKSKRLITA